MNKEPKDIQTGEDKGVGSSELLSELVSLQNKYINMLGNEIDEISPIAHAHGWRSKYVETGERLREQIRIVKKKIR